MPWQCWVEGGLGGSVVWGRIGHEEECHLRICEFGLFMTVYGICFSQDNLLFCRIDILVSLATLYVGMAKKIESFFESGKSKKNSPRKF